MKTEMLDFLGQCPATRQAISSSDFATHIAGEIWGRNSDTLKHEAEFYLDYYTAKIDSLDIGRVHPSSHREVLENVNFVKERRFLKLRDLRVQLVDLRPVPAWLKAKDETAVRQALSFGASLWLFLNVSQWQENESLYDLAGRTFDPASKSASNDDDALHLNARALCHIGGMELVWTSDLCEHLRLELVDRKHPQLLLFRHASYLRSRSDAGQGDVFPDGLLRETAETLALLFPFAESPNKRWDRRVRKKADLDVEAGVSCNTPRNLAHYRVWKERLALIQQTFDRSKPDSFSQWLHDKRDSDKFYTFWFAVLAIVLTLFFGLIQSITGIIQAIKS